MRWFSYLLLVIILTFSWINSSETLIINRLYYIRSNHSLDSSRTLRRKERLYPDDDHKEKKFKKRNHDNYHQSIPPPAVKSHNLSSLAHLASSHRKRPRKVGNRTVPCPREFKQMFLWDAVNDPVTSSWFNVSDLHEVTTKEEHIELDLAEKNKNRIFFLTSGAVQRHINVSMMRNVDPYQFEYPNPFNKDALDDLFDVKSARKKNRKMAVFRNARVTDDGVIINNDFVCQAVRNGGANYSSKDTVSYLSYQNDSIPQSRHYSHLITLSHFAQGSWHFPMELLVALANVDPGIILKSKIHVKSASDKKGWLNLVGINMRKVVTGDNGTVIADNVYAPQMGVYGKPSTSQMYWIREQANNKLQLNITSLNYVPNRRSIVLVQRQNKGDGRALTDFHLIRNTLDLVAQLLDYDFIIHQSYSSFNEQFSKFANAAMIVAPHGAAGLFINFSPADLCFIELMSAHEPLCFARLAYLRGQDYVGIPRKHTFPRAGNMTLLAVAIRLCGLRGKSSTDPIIPKLDRILHGMMNQGRAVPAKNVACPPEFQQLFLWDAAKNSTASSWFSIVYKQHNSNNVKISEKYEIGNKSKRYFFLHRESVLWGLNFSKSMMGKNLSNITPNQFEFPKLVNVNALNLLFNLNAYDTSTQPVALFKNARVMENGLIMNNDVVCQAVRNGGSNSSAPQVASLQSYQHEMIPKDKHYSCIITLASVNLENLHFLLEQLVGLANVDAALVANSHVHVTNLHWGWTWLRLLGIKTRGVISGRAIGDVVYAPKLPMSNMLSPAHVEWLRKLMLKQLEKKGDTKNTKRAVVYNPCKIGIICSDEMINVKKNALQLIAHELGYDFVVINDIKNYRMSNFDLVANAAIVVAPYGSAGIFTVFAPSDACFIDVFPTTSQSFVMGRLAYMRGQDYISVSTAGTIRVLSKFATALAMCSLRRSNSSMTHQALDRIIQPLSSTFSSDHYLW